MIDHTDRTPDQLRHRALAGSTRLRILKQLADRSRPVSIADLARQIDLHPNTVRIQLGQLVEAGLVVESREETGGRGRPRQVFAAVPDASPAQLSADQTESSTGGEEDTRYKMLAEVLVERLEQISGDPRDRALQTGRDWGRQLAEQNSGELPEILDDLGFAPGPIDMAPIEMAPIEAGPVEAGPTQSRRELALHHCPFGEVARAHQTVVCNIHLGLMQGVLAARGGPLRARSIRPFVKPDLCLTQLDPWPTQDATK